MNRVIDEQQRKQALDHTASFAVTAPAGSGKTELLTKRMLKLLAHVECPEEILAITFTRKAASEMRHRILSALQQASQPEPKEPHQRELWQLAQAVIEQDQNLGWQLLQNPNRLRLQTIDSFCMSLVKQMPVTSGLGSEAMVVDQAEPLYREASRRLLAQLQESGPATPDLELLMQHLDNNTALIERLFCNILAKREQWLRHLVGNRADLKAFKGYLEDCLECLVEETLTQAQLALSQWEAPLIESISFAAKNLPDAGLPDNATGLPGGYAYNLPQWQAITNLLLTKSDSWRSRLTKKEGFPTSSKKAEKELFAQAKEQALGLIAEFSDQPDLLGLLREVRTLPQPTYNETQWLLLGRLSHLLPLLVAELMLIFREQGAVDYQQITTSALAALGHGDAPSDIALMLDYQLKHILVDEFQDTASVQFELLTRLTEGWQPEDGRTTFIVGDGMQSCYGFRDANVGLFLAARQFGIGDVTLEPLDLQVNFRSHEAIVDWVNQTFKQAFPAKNEIARGAVSYSDSVAFSSEGRDDAVSFYACINDHDRTQEAEKLVALVKQAQQDQPAESKAILVRNRSHLQDILPILQREGIQWVGVEIEPLAERTTISDLLALTKAMLNPSDRIAWLSILRAPWCGLELVDMEILGGLNQTHRPLFDVLNDDETVALLSSAGQIAAQRLRSVLNAAWQQRARKPLRSWIEGVWLAIGGPAATHSSNDLDQVAIYFELLEKHESGSEIDDLDEFCSAVDRIYAKPAIAEMAIQVMTIHKAKGLEFDQVFVPGLDRTSRSQSNELLLWHERLSLTGESQLLISPISAKGENDDDIYAYIKQEHKHKERLENTRLIYVAATRAIKKLTLTACLKQSPNSESYTAPPADSLLSSIWPAVEQEAIRVDEQGNTEKLELANSELLLTRLKSSWECPQLPQGNLLSIYRGHEYQSVELEEETESEAEWVADMVKAIFLGLAESGTNSQESNAAFITRLLDWMSSHRNSHGSQSARKLVVDTLEAILCSEIGQWMLAPEHQDRQTNWEVMFKSAGQSIQLCVPLSFVANGERWLIEFDDSDFSSESELSAAAENRLALYRSAASQISPAPIKSAIYYPFRQELAVTEAPF